jgi:hypothetical protein
MIRRIELLAYFILSIFCILTMPFVSAQSSDLIMETERHWETYGVGGTCNHGTHNLFLSDIDNDGTVEIISGAFQYDKNTAGTRGTVDIISWDGQDFTVDNTETYPGNIECVYAADADGDKIKEIFTGGIYSNETGVYPTLRVWRWNNNELSLVAHHEGVAVAAIFVADVDKTGDPEIITIGELAGQSDYASEIGVWNLQQNELVIRQDLKLRSTNPISVCAHDLNGDNETEIITAGYANDLSNSKGQLQVWNWSNEGLLLKAEKTWQTLAEGYARNIAGGVLGNTVVNNVKVGDVDGDGVSDIVTGGFTYDGEKVKAQLIVWNWSGDALSQKNMQEWATDSMTLLYCLSLNDVDKDNKLEVATGGMLSEFNSFKSNGTSSNQAELTVWGWNGGALALVQSENWTIGEGVCVWNVGTADLENDGTVEIITEGCMSYQRLCDPDLRIWSVQSEIDNSAINLIAVVGIALAVSGVIASFILIRRRKVNSKP